MRRAGALAIAAIAVVLVLGAAACSDDDSSSSSSPSASSTTSTTTTSVDACQGCPVYGEDDTTIAAKAGDEFVIELESNSTTGYQWTSRSSDEAVVSEQSNEYVQPSSDALGAPGKQRFVFAASQPGAATLTLLYSRSFEDGADAREIAYTVTVT